eukprot:TRINITY_DN14172_c0_g1_i2.p1 TRINITY_DN14172_c0_g1~~TRINITY_DN14172_c0_g1_i2.p1  ORF type:complete len:359 (+),score=81.08 TRINITY_DN14172_c0_g1_i2:70-1146(+)
MCIRDRNMAGRVAGLMGAVVAGVGTVALGGSAITSAFPVPKFSLTQKRFDLDTFKGRMAFMIYHTDPSTLVAREPEIRAAEQSLKDFAAGTSTLSDEQLWAARKLVESAVNDGEIVPEPFRMAGYVPFNGPVCVAMIVSSTTPTLLFWNWVNQSQNALVNYFNRNASSPMSNETLAMSYAGAVGSALTIAYGLSTAVKAKLPPAQATRVLTFVALPTCIAASCLNCYIVRRPEIEPGVPITDADGNVLADGRTSSLAAEYGVQATVASRAFLQFPTFFLPPVFMALPPVAALCAANPALTLPLSTYMTMVCFGFGLPAAIAVFPTELDIKVKDLEPEFHGLTDKQGKPVETVYFYKGL